MNHEHNVWVGRGVANVVRVTADGDQWATHTLKHDAANKWPPTPLLHSRQLASTEQSTKAGKQHLGLEPPPPPLQIVILADYKR